MPPLITVCERGIDVVGDNAPGDFRAIGGRGIESLEDLMAKIATPTQDRLLQVQRALALGASIEEVFARCAIDPWFLSQIAEINSKASEIKAAGDLSLELLRSAKGMGFSDQQIAQLRGTTASEILKVRERLGLFPVYKTVDTCAGEFEAFTPYHYSSYDSRASLHLE